LRRNLCKKYLIKIDLNCDNCPNLVIQRNQGESIQDYNQRWKVWREEQSRIQIQMQCRIMKEIWKPECIQKILDEDYFNIYCNC